VVDKRRQHTGGVNEIGFKLEEMSLRGTIPRSGFASVKWKLERRFGGISVTG